MIEKGESVAFFLFVAIVRCSIWAHAASEFSVIKSF
jgi:hypothetical protein